MALGATINSDNAFKVLRSNLISASELWLLVSWTHALGDARSATRGPILTWLSPLYRDNTAFGGWAKLRAIALSEPGRSQVPSQLMARRIRKTKPVSVRVDDHHLPSSPWSILRSSLWLNSTAADFEMERINIIHH